MSESRQFSREIVGYYWPPDNTGDHEITQDWGDPSTRTKVPPGSRREGLNGSLGSKTASEMFAESRASAMKVGARIAPLPKGFAV